MPYDAVTAERVRRLLPGAVEKRMVGGGLSFSVGGHLVCGVTATALVVRVGADAVPAALEEPHVGPMVLGGRQVRAFVLVGPAGHADDADLGRWVRRGLAVASGLG
ncbi:TfoX N-terminal domain-containing protein [Geodermatophilus saharensis]|uniref:TfoX N-terminal domain-containing protein n=1 Tax=Geodermatophilus saharensis TaxID=1137994 RepID=A0A239BNU2_9ACTN|nr:TfoX/Sxy family protein [Geodermatophilus saharensis]SNS09349.1 TfoX N-terminal domain-containing protein [Geodermatophilus saharensis]